MANTKKKQETVSASQKAGTATNKKAEDDIIIEEKKPLQVKDIDPTQYVTVRNGFQGGLFYRSSRTGEGFKWHEFGDEQEMELRELRNAKNSHKKYFINNWFMFDEDWIIDYLGVGQYYKNAITIEEFDNIFDKNPSDIKKIISGLSEGQKKSVAYRAKNLITSGDIDSNKAIKALEESLGIELVER